MIERLNGRISAFTEVKEILSMVNTKDECTALQLRILAKHIDKQIELDTGFIDIELESMERDDLNRRVLNGRTF